MGPVPFGQIVFKDQKIRQGHRKIAHPHMEYTAALVELARRAMAEGSWTLAEDYLLRTAA